METSSIDAAVGMEIGAGVTLSPTLKDMMRRYSTDSIQNVPKIRDDEDTKGHVKIMQKQLTNSLDESMQPQPMSLKTILSPHSSELPLSPASSEGSRSWKDASFPLSDVDSSPISSTPISRRSSSDSIPPPPPPPTPMDVGTPNSERMMGLSDISGKSTKYGHEGPLSPTLKLMMQKYAAADATERRLSESSGYNSSNSKSEPSTEEGDEVSENVNCFIPNPPPPPPPMNENLPAAPSAQVDQSLAAAIASIQLKSRPRFNGNEGKASPPPLLSQGSMDGVMSDLNKKLLARKKTSEVSAINIVKNPQIPKYKETGEGFKFSDGIQTPPLTPSKSMTSSPLHRVSYTPNTKKMPDASSVDPVTLNSLKEELVQIIKDEVRAAKDDIIKTMRKEICTSADAS